jgi:predicted TIM-barrel fold metal-dependent hydrolase
MTIIDAHVHLWLRQDAMINGQKIRTLDNGRSLFMGEIRQMLPPFIIDGQNTAEILLSNMNYAQVSAAIVTQEYIDGPQNDYLAQVSRQYPDRFLCCALIDARREQYLLDARQLMLGQKFPGLKIPAQHLILPHRRISLTCQEMMSVFRLLENNDRFLSIDLAPGAAQVDEMEEIIQTFPNLRIAIGHFGMAPRSEWQRQIRLARHPNVFIESGGITWLYHHEFYPYPGAIKAIREAIDLVGPDKLMWGSDYPRTIVAITYRMSYDFILNSPLLTEDEKEQFFGLNAIRFYRLTSVPEIPYIKNMSE